MSLIKLPCILVATVGMHRSFTPPHVAAEGEQVSRKNVLDRYIFTAMSISKPLITLMWAVGIAEAVAILANRFPSWALSQPAISALLSRSNPQDLCLTPLSVTGLLPIASGSLIRDACYRALSRFFTFQLSIREGHRLVTTGPYAIVRHPSYMGMVAVYVGILCWWGARGSWLREWGVLETAGGKVVLGFVGSGVGWGGGAVGADVYRG